VLISSGTPRGYGGGGSGYLIFPGGREVAVLFGIGVRVGVLFLILFSLVAVHFNSLLS